MQAMLGGYLAFAIGRRLRSVQGNSPLREKPYTQRRKANLRALKARSEAGDPTETRFKKSRVVRTQSANP